MYKVNIRTNLLIGTKAKCGLHDILGLSKGLPTIGTNAAIIHQLFSLISLSRVIL